MVLNNSEYLFHVGYGLCKDDLTIEDIPVAAFTNERDACHFIETKQDDLGSGIKIYYLDRPVQDGFGMMQVRYIFNRDTHEFVEGTEAKGIKITGYGVYATYEYGTEENEVEYDTEHIICVSFQEAVRHQKKYWRDGAEAEIEDDVDINVLEHFWGAEKFFSGDSQHKIRLEEKMNELRNTQFEEGKTVAQRIGTVLEDVSNEEIMQYFENHVSGGPGLIRNYLESQIINAEIARMQAAAWRGLEIKQDIKEISQEEKDAFIGGIEMSADYGLEISEYDRQLFQSLMAEREQQNNVSVKTKKHDGMERER